MKGVGQISLLLLLATQGPAWAQCGQELNCQIATLTTDERQAWLDKVEQSRRKSAAYVARAYAAYLEKNPPVQLAKAEERAAAGDYLHDPTLRKNDIVVTDEGFLIFNGSVGRRKYSDFIYKSQVEAEKEILKGAKPSGIE